MKKLFLFLFLFVLNSFFLIHSSNSPVYAAALSFSQPIAVGTSDFGSPWGKSVGDINGDGKMDLVVGGHDGGGLVYFLNTGNTSNWTKMTISSDAGFTTDHEVADINNDGKNDVVSITDNNIYWFNNASGWNQTAIGSDTLHDIEVADLDGDGKIDVVGRNQKEWGTGDELFFYRQISPTSWSRFTISAGGSNGVPNGEGLKVTDLDQDGDPDVIVNSVWYQNTCPAKPATCSLSASTFTKRTFSSSWTHPNVYIDTGDINNDGRVDIVMTPSELAGTMYRISWFEAPVDRTQPWTENNVRIDSNAEAIHHFVGLADFDKDGDLDVAAAEMEQGNDPDEVKIYLNANNGGSWTKQVLSSGGSHSMRVVDVNGDGKMDLYGANWNGSQRPYIWVNQTQTGPTPTPTKLPLTSWTHIQADSDRSRQKFGIDGSRDLTGDGYKDIVSGQYFYRNPGGTMIGSWPRTELPNNTFPDDKYDALLSVNVDDDAFGDFIAMDGGGKVYWLEANNQQGTDWTSRQIQDMGATDEGISTQGYMVAQIEAGGKPEIILNVPNSLAYLEIPASPTSGNWPKTTITSSITWEPEGVAVGDIDGDGDLDIASNATTPAAQTAIAWWANPGTGAGNWTKYGIGTVPAFYADRFGLADLDGDGDLDLAVTVANGSANGVYWFQSPTTKTNTWGTIKPILTASGTSPALPIPVDTMNSMDLADMDKDGDTDIIAAEHRGSQRLFILENSGTGTFTARTISTGIENHLGARVFDLDNDGDLDIIGIAWDAFQNLHVWRNNAISTGGPTIPPVPTSTPGGPTLTPGGPTPIPGNALFRINSGGPQFTDPDSNVWEADRSFSGGTVYSLGENPPRDIANTANDNLYQTERYGNFNYTISVANGSYIVNLYMAETFWTAAGERLFTATVNGIQVPGYNGSNNIDIFAEAGGVSRALVKTVPITVTNGSILIEFTTITDNASVQGIEILSQIQGTPTPTIPPFSQIISYYGTTNASMDVNHDGKVNIIDLVYSLFR